MKLYNVSVMVLALISIIITILDFTNGVLSIPILYWIDFFILIFFWIDYIIRFIKADRKHTFIKSNIFDLLAILPFNTILSMFRIFRIFRIMKMFRFVKMFKLFRVFGFGMKFKKFLHTNGFIYVLYLNVIITLLGACGIYFFEKGTTVKNFGDAIWWAFVTSTTVGYGDISPVTPIGRVIAGLLMITGISCIGMLTGTIATFFSMQEKNKIDVSELNDTEIEKINDYIKKIKKENYF